MNVYDFDKTIYRGDSSVDFYRFCIARHPGALLALPGFCGAAVAYLLGKKDKTCLKQAFFAFLRHLPDVDTLVARFWQRNQKKLAPWYLRQHRPDDIIISASPEFLLQPLCAGLPATLLASQVAPGTGIFAGPNCHGQQKVVRLTAHFGGTLPTIGAAYSDSPSDAPLARLAEKAFLVKGEKLLPWPFEN